ncbi:type-2 ice-structuring protein [Haplochromis burtoni]|uniref:type-2 ice-structuring protein n=1 Tax=Haplochromis burtoni TaxID=8153 RepID=UPI001C2D8550|nr:type-2 ice-structuring protein [Haplochromis burtoni]
MKLLIVSALLCAVMALTSAIDLEDEEGSSGTEELLLTGEDHVVKTPRRCPVGWKMYCKQCFLYVSQALSWAQAQKNCEQMKANLASVHSYREHKFIRRLIFCATRQCKPTWLGGSDAKANYIWTWIDGTNFRYTNWCHGKPSNNYGQCLEMNFSAKKCWNGVFCSCLRPSVCVKKIW